MLRAREVDEIVRNRVILSRLAKRRRFEQRREETAVGKRVRLNQNSGLADEGLGLLAQLFKRFL